MLGDRGGQHAEHQEAGQGGEDRPSLHGPAPGGPPLRPGGAPHARDPQPVDGGAGEAQHRGQQGHGGGQHGEHGEGHGDGRAPHVLEAHGAEAEQRDQDGPAGEQHGPARGPGRLGHRPLGAAALGERAPVAGDDEQRVVDAHADADHRGQHRAPVGDVEEPGHQHGQAGADPQAAEGEHDGDAGGQRGAEGGEQDEQGQAEADALAAGLAALGHLDGPAAGLDRHAVTGGGGCDVDDGLAGAQRERLGGPVQLDREDRGGAVRRPQRRVHGHDVLDGAHLGGGGGDPVLRAGLSIPAGSWTTSTATSPARSGNRSASRSRTAADSEPGMA
jgi:hypothetical protein